MIAVDQLALSASSAGRGLAACLSGRLVSCRAKFFDGREAVAQDDSSAVRPTPQMRPLGRFRRAVERGGHRPVGREADAIWS